MRLSGNYPLVGTGVVTYDAKQNNLDDWVRFMENYKINYKILNIGEIQSGSRMHAIAGQVTCQHRLITDR